MRTRKQAFVEIKSRHAKEAANFIGIDSGQALGQMSKHNQRTFGTLSINLNVLFSVV